MESLSFTSRLTPRSCQCLQQQQRHQQRCLRTVQCRGGKKRLQADTDVESRNTLQTATRRQSLAGLGVALLGFVAGPAQATVTSDLLEGTTNLINIEMQSYGLWMQSMLDDISNDDQTGVLSADQPHKRRFGGVSIPGLSSFSFIHGTLVGGALILLLALASDKQQGAGQQQQLQQVQPQQHLAEQLSPDVEAALRKYLSSPETSATFHDPAVHAAIQEVRSDIKNITKYRNDPAVMQAFEKLLEIEDILERL